MPSVACFTFSPVEALLITGVELQFEIRESLPIELSTLELSFPEASVKACGEDLTYET